MRPNKVDFGVDIAKAVNDKYLKQDDIENIFPSQGEEELLYNNFKWIYIWKFLKIWKFNYFCLE